MRLEIPDAHRAVDPVSFLAWPSAAGEGPAAIRRKGHAPHPAGVPLQATQQVTCFHVPEAHDPVCRAGESAAAIRREGHTPHDPAMTAEATQLLSGFRVPKPHGLVIVITTGEDTMPLG